jgi:hypothetical protein
MVDTNILISAGLFPESALTICQFLPSAPSDAAPAETGPAGRVLGWRKHLEFPARAYLFENAEMGTINAARQKGHDGSGELKTSRR